MDKTWEETVMKENDIKHPETEVFSISPACRRLELFRACKGEGLLGAQAKLTWEARQGEVDEAYQRGRREVVDFVEEHMCNLEEWPGWQEMKEEWGLKECEK